MSTYKYKDGNKQLIANHMEDVENASFRETMIKFHASSMVPALKAYLENDKNCPFPFDDEIIDVVALKMATQTYETYSSEKFDPCFESIFQKELSKKDQIRLLKGVQLKEAQLAAIFDFAEKCGYKFSHYTWQGEPKSVKKEKLPAFMHLNDDETLEYVGDTTLTEGQMRTIIEQAEVLIVQFFDNSTHWHCFLRTFKGLKGKEPGKQGGRPHIHYLSDSFGISKEDLIEMVKMGKYPNTPVHIPLIMDSEKSK